MRSWALAGACFALVAAVGTTSVLAQPNSAPQQPAGLWVDAKEETGPAGTYARTCGYCHGTNVGPILLGKEYPAEAVVFMVRNGKGAMPAFRPSEISNVELQALGEWIAKSKPGQKDHGK
jgi:mono/diheme cytochrome c family protein